MPHLRTLMTGLTFGESPRWHDGRLWFSNWVAQEIIAVDVEGNSEIVMRVPFSTFPFSLAWLPDGRLLMASGSDRPLVCLEPNGSLLTYADTSAVSKSGWNEIVVDGRGNAYVNGAGFDMMAGEPFAPGIIALVTPDRVVREVANDIHFPNGMAVTPDNSTLVVAESYGRRLTAFDIAGDGRLTNRRVWADLKDGAPDGICFDAENAIWYADVPNKRCVRVREGGRVLQTVKVDRGCFACMLGGADRTTLFVLAAQWRGPEKMTDGSRTGKLLTVRVTVPGAGWP